MPALRLVGEGRVHAEPGGSPRGPLGRARHGGVGDQNKEADAPTNGKFSLFDPREGLYRTKAKLCQREPWSRRGAGARGMGRSCALRHAGCFRALFIKCMQVHAWMVMDGDGGSDAGVPPLGGT